MFNIFSTQKTSSASRHPDFSYISDEKAYFDSACQTLRPQPIINAELEYYQQYNACGHRVKYPWGEKVDMAVMQTRQDMVAFVGKSYRDYETAFTLNTTYGINLVLSSLQLNGITQVITSEIEHNSVFLPAIDFTKKHHLAHVVLKRHEDGSLQYQPDAIKNAIIIVNTTSNIDGRHLQNAKQLIADAHDNGSIVLLDAAQTVGHTPQLLHDLDFDALFTSGHKMYAPSLGIIVIKRRLLAKLEPSFVGGGMVTDVDEHAYTSITDERELFSRLEPGLQNWAGIIGLQAALAWLKKPIIDEAALTMHLRTGLESIQGLHLLSPANSSVQSVYTDKLDAHQIALALGQHGIMARSGYFCCHYYLKHVRNLPPLLRISLGLHNTTADINQLIKALAAAQTNF